ncbi:peroxiredoxin [Neocallimastix lanati (nom. inval.)]|jgi:glutathione peroxidase|uniref:Glutathione peroxidase n=1 Tax=Neocallimastix californiae TaxID=1754190 RepID=A0A1Y2A6F5_9FUNG|nr:peroxiredoxin [Neocallimastix sp. JGI-2020a]ORY18091.1 peroxiredoxin [Neocallimastix californiae]|eukprot:ORY18091.1 peroxiredoxin [Neocallimastix californiae]
MSIYDIKVENRKGEEFALDQLKGKVLLIVNTATGCGFTPQYKGLEKLYENYHDKGLEILDFPCNQFLRQAPGTDDEIHNFCTLKYNTKFDQFRKIDVNGDNASPLYKYLKEQIQEDEINGTRNKLQMKGTKAISFSCKKPGDIVWNFTKFLVDKEGKVVGRYSPTFKPEELESRVKELLGLY